MRFSVGDLVAEKKTNHWFFTNYGLYGYAHPSSEYWDEYYERTKHQKPLIGIVIEVVEKDEEDYYIINKYNTYKVMWINCTDHMTYLMDRYFFGDELRLISKINNDVDEENE